MIRIGSFVSSLLFSWSFRRASECHGGLCVVVVVVVALDLGRWCILMVESLVRFAAANFLLLLALFVLELVFLFLVLVLLVFLTGFGIRRRRCGATSHVACAPKSFWSEKTKMRVSCLVIRDGSMCVRVMCG